MQRQAQRWYPHNRWLSAWKWAPRSPSELPATTRTSTPLLPGQLWSFSGPSLGGRSGALDSHLLEEEEAAGAESCSLAKTRQKANLSWVRLAYSSQKTKRRAKEELFPFLSHSLIHLLLHQHRYVPFLSIDRWLHFHLGFKFGEIFNWVLKFDRPLGRVCCCYCS